MQEEHTKYALEDICHNCGEEYGRHRASDGACPERDGKRFSSYNSQTKWDYWDPNDKERK